MQDARNEFQEHGLADIVTAAHRDVCGNGFPEELNGVADAVFLDLPLPWEAVAAAKKALKPNGRICCFSPCIEQVQRTCLALHEQRFIDITTAECVQRQYEARQVSLPIADLSKKVWVERPGKRYEDQVASEEQEPAECGDEPMEASADAVEGDKPEDSESETTQKAPSEDSKKVKKFYAAQPIVEVAGHTGYLTFATSFH